MHADRSSLARRSAITLIAILVGGCALSVEVDDSEPLTHESFLAGLAERRCVQQQQCSRVAEFPTIFFDLETCQAEWLELTDPLEDTLLAAGSLRFDHEAARQCLRAYDQSPCTGDRHPACQQAVVPTVADGEPCAADRECTSGRCARDPSGCGRCVTALALGTPCGDVDPAVAVCGRGSYCPAPPPGSAEATCVPAPGQGPLAPARAGEACDYLGLARTYVTCDVGLVCNDDHRCEARRRRGSPCETGQDQCEAGTQCRPHSDGSLRCVEVRRTSEIGVSCSLADGKVAWACDRRLGLACDPLEFRCVHMWDLDQPLGSYCIADASCASGYCAGGACRIRSGTMNGEFCFENGMCASSYCLDWVCTSPAHCEAP